MIVGKECLADAGVGFSKVSGHFPARLRGLDGAQHGGGERVDGTESGSMARSERFELPTFWFVARRSIQLSYERAVLVTLMLTSACSAVKQ